MNQTFIYYTFLLFIIFITINNILENYKYSPKKLKSIISISLLLQIIRVVSLIILGVVNRQIYVSFLKYTVFLDILYIPLIIILAFYIFLRSDKLKMKYLNISTGILICFYLVMLYYFKPFFKATWEFGYIIGVENELFFRGVYSLLVILILGVILFFKKESHSNKRGLVFLICISGIILGENLLSLVGIKFLNGLIISECILTFLCFYIVNTFKRNRALVNG